MELLLRLNTQAGTTVVRLFKDPSNPASYKEFTCTVSVRGRDYSAIPAAELQDLLKIVGSATITVAGGCPSGLDGVSYELTIEDGAAHATYRWWMTPQEGWRPLGEIAARLLNLGFRVSGQYLT